MRKGIIVKLREKIYDCDKSMCQSNKIKCARKVLLQEIDGDRDKLLNIKANLNTSGDMSDVAVAISVFALISSIFRNDNVRILVGSIVFIVCTYLYDKTQSANDKNKYIRTALEDIEENWNQYFPER